MKTSRTTAACAIALLTLAAAACTKKVAATNPPVSPAPAPVAARTPAPAPATAPRSAAPTPVASAPASRGPDAATRARIDQLLARISDAYFDYNKASLRPDAVKTLQTDSVELRNIRSEEHTSELQSQSNLVCRLL